MLTDVFCDFRSSLALTFIYILKISQRCDLLRNRPQCEYSLVHYKAVMCETGSFFPPKLFPWLNCVYCTWKLSLPFYLKHFKITPCSNTNCDLLVLLLPCPFWWHYLIQTPHCWIFVIFFMTTPVLENVCHLVSKTLYGNPNPWNLLGAVNVRLMVSNPAIYWSASEC